MSRDRTFNISINFVKSLDQYALAQFLSGRQTECPQDIITALDIVLRESASNKYVTVSRSFFSHQFGKMDMSGGLECWRGYFQSIRPTQMGLSLKSLNADTSATPFYKSMSILTFISGFYNERHTLTSLSDRERHEIQKALNGVRVETVHLPNVRRRYRITGITSQSAKELMFTLDETAGTKISVAQYFRTHCKYNLRHDSLPCIKAGSDSKPKYLPLEVCQIVDGQRYVKKLNEVQVSEILKVACTPPTEREGKILELVRKNNYDNDLFAKNFGIGVQPNLITVEARVLQPPRLKYHDSGAEKGCQPFGGKWSMNNKKVFRGGSVDAWACISFSRHYKNIVQDFCHEIVFACNRIGMVFNQNALIIDSGHHQRIENSIHDFVKACAKPLQLLVVILPEAKGAYGRIKKYCDTELGIVTQCCQSKHLNKPNRQYFENLALKINVKAGGCNTVLEDSVRGSIPVISEEPSIIFGADVTHPAPGEDSSSIAAVVASMDWPYVTKYKCLLSAQQRTREIIEKLYTKTDDGVPGGMIRELLFAFHKATGRKPNRIIFYRDGVSEGQFNIVLTSELDAIRRACASIQEGYLPPTTFIVVQKRHHTRLFPENTKMADRSGNILPGTVVDTKICHPNEFDFYLCSHAGIQGTSRPAHYHVLHDENNFTADQLQSLTNNLCYTYARCTRSVSIVPPAYYAHLAAFRARYYIDTGSEYASSQVSGKTRQRTATASAATTSAAPTTGLPAIPENVANVMFYC
ncbi:protein argonaute MEL1-like [Phalaenopsis equestris]|uniref:protein argonaute MEL1-like n=1 Tax=Phalaenopsis equestris TaxID=78828 RepID=UPI0009E3EF0F|nr:protein argonaute MEL1-like [Phalaenopsis equestris]